MASSGWQGEKTIYSGGSTTPRIDGDLRVDSITHSGSNLTITGVVQVISPSNSSIYYNGAYIWWDGGGSATRNLNSNYGTKDTWNIDFSVTIGGVAATTTSYYFEMGVDAIQSGGSIGWTLSFNQSGTQPSGLSATFVDAGPDWADIAVNLSSWGSPSTSANRYIEAAVLGSSSYGNPYKYKTATAVMSNTFHVDNSGGGSLTIVPNTQYRVGAYATNTVMSKSTVGSTFITKPARPTLTAIDQGHGVIDFTVTHATEGSADTVTEEYSTDGGTTWTTITGGAFSLTLASQTEVMVRRGNTTGYMTETVTVTPTFTYGIYASVINKTAAIKKVYAPVGGESKKVKKIYASVGGKTKLVFEDPS